MSIPGSASPLFLASTAAAGAYDIPRSLRFNSGDSAYLSRTPSSAGNRRTWTWSGWVKRSKLNVHQDLFTAGGSTSQPRTRFRFQSNNIISVGFNPTGSLWYLNTTSSAYRDTSAWCHIVLVCDTTQSTSSDRLKLYVNGVLQSFGTASYVPQNTQTTINNNTYPHSIGREQSTAGNYFDGYLADVHFIDGQALAATDFGEYDDNNVWQPIEYAGTYGTNGFKLDFSDTSSNAALGTDSSGNGNTWTVNNLSVAAGAGNDALRDTPVNGNSANDTGAGGEITGNYATLNPLVSTGDPTATLTDGNLTASFTSALNYAAATIGITTGKYYYEMTASTNVSSSDTATYIRGCTSEGTNETFYHWRANGGTSGLTGSPTLSTYTSGDILGVGIDATNSTVRFYKNGTLQGSGDYSYTTFSGKALFISAFANPGNRTCHWNFGQRAFAYTAPSGYKALCTANLPDPTIADGSTAFDTKLYTGNNSTQTISGLNFSPDLVWIKNRAAADNHKLLDTVRGATNELESNTTDAEVANADGLTAFNSDGFDLGADVEYNTSSEAYVAWTWDAGSSTVTNTDGSISAQVRANPSAGFSIVSWTGNNTNGATVGHGLNAIPKLTIYKNRSISASWIVNMSPVTGTGYLVLNSTVALDTNGQYVSPTSTTLVLPSYSDTNANSMIAYCFAPVEGYSAFGSYTGNGSTDGPFVFTGFRPRWILIKSSSISPVSQWGIWDTERNTYNVTNSRLSPNTSGAETIQPAVALDVLSNGFKPRTTDYDSNQSGDTYIYAAFAEHPFKSSRAR